MATLIKAFIFLLLALIPILIIRHYEKKDYNEGRCKTCGGKLRYFDTDSQGGRGYRCENCHRVVWVSWGADKPKKHTEKHKEKRSELTLFKKIKGHLSTVFRHKKYVYQAMRDCGHPIRGLLHDMSKFGPVELFESIKFYTGDRSPIENAKKKQGYSDAWLHHKGKNKHHSQYWIDNSWGVTVPLEIPFKYLLELICDTIGAGKAYSENRGEKWHQGLPIQYYRERDCRSYYHPKTREKLTKYYLDIAELGWDYVSTRIKVEGDYVEQQFKIIDEQIKPSVVSHLAEIKPEPEPVFIIRDDAIIKAEINDTEKTED